MRGRHELGRAAPGDGIKGRPIGKAPVELRSAFPPASENNQEGSRNQNNQSIPLASAPCHTTHNLSHLAFGEAETTGLWDLSQRGFCNPPLPNASGNDMEEGTVDEVTVEELVGVASPVGHLNTWRLYSPIDIR